MAKKYLIRDAKQLDHDFYTRFDEGFIFRRVETLAFIVEEYDAFKKLAEEKGGTLEGGDKKYLEGLRAEIHFAEMHQAECLFALMMALFQPLPHWLYLTTYNYARDQRGDDNIRQARRLKANWGSSEDT